MPEPLHDLDSHAHDIVATIEASGVITHVAPSIQPTLGLAPAEVIGNVLWELVHPADVADVHAAIADVFAAGSACAIEFQILGVAGRWHRLDAAIQLVQGESRLEAVLTASDVTERRRVEAALRERDEQLRQARKMEVVGRLAGGITHDFGNLLTVIIGASGQVLDGLPPTSPLRPPAESIRTTAERAASMVRQLMSFSRQREDVVDVVDLNDVVGDAEELLDRLLGGHIQFNTVRAPGLWPVKADRTQIEQVLLNLAVNARDAMPGGGTLTFETRNLPGELNTHPGWHGVASAIVVVSDTGIGMDAETQARAFEPFFTTKAIGEGTGLGLATVQQIVQGSGGWVQLTSEPGKGTSVAFGFPKAAESVTPAPIREAPAAGGHETILLVEDEHGVRELVRDMLAMAGYNVLEAATPVDAERMSREATCAIDLLLTDVVMPEMTGLELSNRLRQHRPGLRVMYMSGFPELSFGGGQTQAPGSHFINKPFNRQELLRAARRALD